MKKSKYFHWEKKLLKIKPIKLNKIHRMEFSAGENKSFNWTELNWLPTGIINLIKHCAWHMLTARINHIYRNRTFYITHSLTPLTRTQTSKFQLKLFQFFDRWEKSVLTENAARIYSHLLKFSRRCRKVKLSWVLNLLPKRKLSANNY